MYLISRAFYYLASFITLIRGVRNWPLLLELRIPRQDFPVIHLRDGAQFAVRSLMDAWIIKETNLDRDYEVHGAPIQDGWNIVDIGAGLGDFTVFAARRAPQGRIYAYEPAPDSAELLRRNIALNGITNVEAHELAVAAQNGVLTLDISGGVAVQYKTAGVLNADGSGKIEVRSVALAEVLDSLPGGMCDFLKMDVEGAEYEMLLHLDESAVGRIRRVCLEYHEGVTEHTHVDLKVFFEAHGWRVRVHPSRVQAKLGFLYAESVVGSRA